jgi:hypothetical protein
VTILDDDTPAVVQWNSAAQSANENSGVSILLLRTGGPSNVSVIVVTSNGTALAGQDFVAISNNITFAPAETAKAVSIALLDSYPVEGDETFSVALLNPVAATIGALSNHVVTIRDSALTPEDLYGHSLTIADNNLVSYNLYSAEFTNDLTIYNPTPGTSRPGRIPAQTVSGFPPSAATPTRW